MLERLSQGVEELKKVAEIGETEKNGFIIVTPNCACSVGTPPTIMTLISQMLESFIESFDKHDLDGLEALDVIVERVKETYEKK